MSWSHLQAQRMCGRLAYAFEQATKRRVPPPAAP
jgi:hypothetical protein